MTLIIGIDFSMQCPCLCRFEGEEFSFDKCVFHYLTSRKKFERISPQINGYSHQLYSSPEERFDQITNWTLSHIDKNAIIFLEGYSFGSRAGLAFNIGELGGLLKHKLYKNNNEYHIVPPTVVKKFATSKGNSKKDMMYEAFYKETKFNLLEELNIKVGSNPQSDIVDSYWLCKYGFTILKK